MACVKAARFLGSRSAATRLFFVGIAEPVQIAVQRRGGEGFAAVLLPSPRQTLQCPVILCGDDLFEFCFKFCCLVFLDGSLSAGDGLGFQVLVLLPLSFESLHAGEGHTESCGYLLSGLPALQGLEDAFPKIGGERLHTLRIT